MNAVLQALGLSAGGGRRNLSAVTGCTLPAAGEKITQIVKAGTYEDCDLSHDVKEHPQMHVRVGVLLDTSGKGMALTGMLQLLDVRKISGNKILVLREPRLSKPVQYGKIEWPCDDEAICNLRGGCSQVGADVRPRDGL